MSFSLILLVIVFLVIIPELLRRYKSWRAVDDAFFGDWVDQVKAIPALLDMAFGKIPRFKYDAHTALFFALLFIYLSHEKSSDTIGILALVMFAYLGHLFSDELFDTFWNSIISLFSFFVIFSLISGIINFIFVEADWTIIWRNRRMLLVGPYFVNPFTGSEIWRLWPPFYLIMVILGSAYGSLGEKRSKFLVPYAIFGLICVTLLVYEADYESVTEGGMTSNRGYDPMKSLILLLGGLVAGCASFLAVHSHYHDAEEYKIKYFHNLLISFTVFSFIITIMILDPPDIIAEDDGVKPSAWGGLVLNLIFATAAIVVGFGVGVGLAFGRRSNLPVFYLPSITVIETIRSGPLVAWLFFAQILLPDVVNPVWEADIASRVILVLSLFFGCYLAEVLRGGLQAVPYGQYEAATALGLSPLQIKLQIELPQAIRTTLPAIVSLMIGMLKDTSLVYFFGIYDAFRVAKDLPAQWDFIGQHEQALLFVGMTFWILSFYLSKISRRIEKNLGLAHEGGGEAT